MNAPFICVECDVRHTPQAWRAPLRCSGPDQGRRAASRWSFRRNALIAIAPTAVTRGGHSSDPLTECPCPPPGGIRSLRERKTIGKASWPTWTWKKHRLPRWSRAADDDGRYRKAVGDAYGRHLLGHEPRRHRARRSRRTVCKAPLTPAASVARPSPVPGSGTAAVHACAGETPELRHRDQVPGCTVCRHRRDRFPPVPGSPPAARAVVRRRGLLRGRPFRCCADS